MRASHRHDEIDRIVRLGAGLRMGPFELMDLIGIDVNFAVARSFWEQSFGEPRWRPDPDPRADGRVRPAGPEDRSRLLHLRERHTPHRPAGPGRPTLSGPSSTRTSSRKSRARTRPPVLTRLGSTIANEACFAPRRAGRVGRRHQHRKCGSATTGRSAPGVGRASRLEPRPRRPRGAPRAAGRGLPAGAATPRAGSAASSSRAQRRRCPGAAALDREPGPGEDQGEAADRRDRDLLGEEHGAVADREARRHVADDPRPGRADGRGAARRRPRTRIRYREEAEGQTAATGPRLGNDVRRSSRTRPAAGAARSPPSPARTSPPAPSRRACA